MDFRILGPVELVDGGNRVPLGGPKPRSVFAALAVVPGHVVPDYRIREILWDGPQPATANAQIRTYVYGIRKIVAPHAQIVRQSQGYRLDVPADRVDLLEFERLVRDGRRRLKEGALDDAAHDLQAGLSLWRGPALTGVTDALARAERPRLEEARLAALEDWAAVGLALGRHNELVSELTRMVSQHPLRERLSAQLMIALYRSGRQADALAVYHETREVLADELGIDPGAELRTVHEQILAADPRLDLRPSQPAVTSSSPSSSPSRSPSPSPMPRAQLPPNIADFSGREKEATQLSALLRSGKGEPGAQIVPVVTGMPGVGKTTLAVYVAHACADNFPDGQLFVDLRGDQLRPVNSGEALGLLLRLLGVEGSAIPDDIAQRTQLYRERLTNKSVLVLLDNAADVSQVRPLLPNNPACSVVVTSRYRLTALEGVQLFDLDVFEHNAARDLLTRIIGPEAVAADPESAESVLRLCDYLPLAIRIAAARLAARPHWPISRLALLLEDERSRLDELCIADLEVRAGLMLSYRALSPEAARVFRLLALLNAPSFNSWIAAGMLDIGLDKADELVDTLVDRHLLQVGWVDADEHFQFRFHDLVHAFAYERAIEDQEPEDRTHALDRALSAWLTLAEDADRRLPSQCFGVIKGDTPRWNAPPSVRDTVPGNPIAWFEANRAALVSAVAQACETGRVTLAWELAQALTNFFDLRSLYDDWLQTHERVLAAARLAGDELGQAVMLRGLAERSAFFNDHSSSLGYAQAALRLFERLKEGMGEVDVLYQCADAYRQTGHPETAVACLERGMRRALETGHRVGEARLHDGLGGIHTDHGRLEEALRSYQKSQELWRDLHKPRYQAIMMRSVGIVERDLGQFPAAAMRLEECLSLFRDLGDGVGEAYTRNSLGDLCRKWGSRDRARIQYERAMTLFAGIGLTRRFGDAIALRGLAELDSAEGELGSAIDLFTRALQIWRDLDMPVWEARTLLGLGDAQAAQGDTRMADETWRAALQLCERLALPESADVRWRLETHSGS